jgi:AcrR family transcriptional regulator
VPPLTAVKETRLLLIDATLRVLDRDGIAAVTLRAVAAELGVSAPAVYWHFEDKEALMNEIRRLLAADFVARMRAASSSDPSGSASIEVLTDVFLDFTIEHPHRFQLLFRSSSDSPNKPLKKRPGNATTFGSLIQAAEQGMERGELARDDPTSVALSIAALGQGLVLLYERGRFSSKAEFADFARVSFRRLLRGLRA